MDSEAVYNVATSADPPAAETVREPIDPRRELDGLSSNSISHRSSPHGEDLNQFPGSLPSSAAAPPPAVSSGPSAAMPPHYTSQKQHQQQQPQQQTGGSTNDLSSSPGQMYSSSGPSHQKSAHMYSSQLRKAPSGPLSPLTSGRTKSANNMYVPMRLDTQLLGSARSNAHPRSTGPPAPSPTRSLNGAVCGPPFSSYWNATLSPVPYPCGSPTAYGGASQHRIMSSPSTNSLRPQQQFYGNDGSSPMQLSISNMTHENSYTAGVSSFGPAGQMGMMHPAILDAPLQLSLVPPPYFEERPYFSFGNAIMHSTAFSPTSRTPTSRTHSIYHDTMLELSQHKSEMDNPLNAYQCDGVRTTFAHDCSPASLADGAISLGAAAIPATPNSSIPSHSLPVQRLTSDTSFASGPGATMPGMLAETKAGPNTWSHLEKAVSPATPAMLEPLTARPTLQSVQEGTTRRSFSCDDDDDDEEEAAAACRQGSGEYGQRRCRSRHGTPDVLASTGHTEDIGAAVAAAAVTPRATSVSEEDGDTSTSIQIKELMATRRPRDVVQPQVSAMSVSDRDMADRSNSISAGINGGFSVSEFNLGDVDGASHKPSTTAPTEPLKPSAAYEMTTPQTLYTRQSNLRSTAPGAAPTQQQLSNTSAGEPTGVSGHGLPEYHLYMPSPVDQSAQIFGSTREGGPNRRSPSEHSASMLSLVPNFGVWQASPTLMPTWQSLSMSPSSSPNTRSAFEDLLEVLRLLQSDIRNIYNCVSINEHMVRHGVRSTLSTLLHLAAEISHSVALSATDEADDGGALNQMSAASGKADAAVPGATPTYAQLSSEIRTGAARCVEVLQKTIQSVCRDQEVLEPLLLTSMLAREATTAILHSLERGDGRSGSYPSGSAASAGPTKQDRSPNQMTAANTSTNRRFVTVIPLLTPLSSDRVEALMDGEVLAAELNGGWRQFATEYNRRVLHYLFLRVVHAAMSRDGSPQSKTAEGTSTPPNESRDTAAATLKALEAMWIDEQLQRWSTLCQRRPHKLDRNADTKSSSKESAQGDAEKETELFAGALCQDLLSYDRLSVMFASFRDGDTWNYWYSLLDQIMECNFHAQRSTSLCEHLERQLLQQLTPPAAAARHAMGTGQVVLEEIEDELDKAEASLATFEEQGKARRITILRLILRRIFVLAVVTSVHRALGRDAAVSDAQLASFVQLQRKSLEEVEAKMTAEHAECATHLQCIRTFLALFSKDLDETPTDRDAATPPVIVTASKAQSRMRMFPVNSAVSVPSPDPPLHDDTLQWNSPTVGALATLLMGTRSRSNTTESSEDAEDNRRRNSSEDMDETQRRTKDSVVLVQDVVVRIFATIKSLCVLLLSEENASEAERHYKVSPAKIPIPSTRALRRLQSSLADTYQSIMVCIASLHIVD